MSKLREADLKQIRDRTNEYRQLKSGLKFPDSNKEKMLRLHFANDLPRLLGHLEIVDRITANLQYQINYMCSEIAQLLELAVETPAETVISVRNMVQLMRRQDNEIQHLKEKTQILKTEADDAAEYLKVLLDVQVALDAHMYESASDLVYKALEGYHNEPPDLSKPILEVER